MSPSSMRKKSRDVKSAGRPLSVMVPSHTLLEASRLFSATMCVCRARPSGIAPRLIAKAREGGAAVRRPARVLDVVLGDCVDVLGAPGGDHAVVEAAHGGPGLLACYGPSARSAELGSESLLEQPAGRFFHAEDLLEDVRRPGDGADGDQDAVGVDDLPVLDELVVANAEDVRGGGLDRLSGRRDAGVVARAG